MNLTKHSALTTSNGIHYPISGIYADATARTAATGDQYKFYYQTDTKAVWQYDGGWRLIGAVGLSGDISVTVGGVVTVTDLTIASEARGDILRRGASAWERHSAKTDKQILIGDGTDIKSVAVSGDISITNAGAVTVKRPLGFLVTGALTASTAVPKIYASLPYAMTLSLIRIGCGTAPTGSDGITVDVHYHATDPTAATTIFTTGPGTNRPVIAASGFSDDSGAPDVTSLAANGFISIYVDTVGGTIAGSDLSVWLIPA